MVFAPFRSGNILFSVFLFSGRRFSFSSSSSSSRLLNRYGFIPPPSLLAHRGNTISEDRKDVKTATINRKKPPYRPPSSLDRSGQKPIHSVLPFDFRLSYTESSSAVKPIGIREPKYSPFGPGRVDRVWTGFGAPAVDPTVTSVDGDGPEQGAAAELDSKSKETRARVLGEPLTPSERAFLIQKCQKNQTKQQVNLRNMLQLYLFFAFLKYIVLVLVLVLVLALL